MDNTDDALRQKPTKTTLKKKTKVVPGGKVTTIVAKKKKKKKKKKGLFKKIGGALKKVVKATVGGAALLPLRPFTGAMKKGLKKRGVSTKGMKFNAIVGKFYNEFVSKKGKKGSHYEEIAIDDFVNDVAFYTPLEGFDYETDHAIVGAVVDVVKGVISLFKNAKNKKAAAKKAGMTKKEYEQQVSEDDRMFADEADQVTEQLEQKSVEDKAMKQGDMKKFIIYGVIIAAIGATIYFISKHKK